MKVAEYIAEFLVKNGITDCFTVTGGGAMHLNDAFGHCRGMRCTFNHHEQACAIAAEAYTRYSGRLAAVCVTSGPGGTNAITGVLGGWVDSVPMFVVSGQIKRETSLWCCPELKLRQLGDQEFNIVDTVSNMTKYAVMVTNPVEIAYHLEKALYLATENRGGPVWLDIPLDVQGVRIEPDKLIHFDSETERPWKLPPIKEAVISDILEKIQKANSPLIFAGTGIRFGGAEKEFIKLVEKLKIPVIVDWHANDVLEYDSPYFVGMPGTVGTRPGNFALQNCDLLLSLGSRHGLRTIGYNHFDFAKNAYKIIVDIDPNELAKPTVYPDMPIRADIKELLTKLSEHDYTAQEKHGKWLAWCRALLEKYPVVLPSYHDPDRNINPYVFADILFSKLNSDDKIVCGNGSACVITFQTAKVKNGQRLLTNSGSAPMGYGLPAALGVAVFDNDKRTVCIDGDGSIMMNLQELATVSHNDLNIKIMMINNSGYLSIKQTQRNLFQAPPFIGTDETSGVGFPDFKILAQAFGLKYYRIETESEADGVLDKLLAEDGACVCEVTVDAEQNFAPKSSSRVLADGTIVSPSLDDMAPFLDRNEYEKIRYTGE